MKISPLAFGSISFLGGVFVSDIFREYWVLNLLFLFFLVPVFLRNFWIFSGEQSQKSIIFREYLSLVFSGIFGFLTGSIFLFFSLSSQISENTELLELAEKLKISSEISGNTKESVTVEAIISSFPKYKSNKVIFEADIQNLKNPEKTLVTIFRNNQELKFGQKIEISGKIVRPEQRIGEKFHYGRFLEKSEIYTFFPYAQVKILEKTPEEIGEIGIFWQKVLHFRTQFENEIRKKLPVIESEYALGILLGAEWGIPQNILEEFNNTGLRHLLALSGFNITILILILFQIFFFLPKFLRIILSIILITFFVLITGASSSVVRAAIMGGLGLIILHSGRGSAKNIPKLVLITLVCMTLWNPFVLVSDASLQFSILAVLGLYYFVPVLQKKFPTFTKKHLFLANILFATLAAQLFTLPLQLVLFEKFSLISPLANIIVAPITSFAMLFAFLVSIPYVGWIFVPISFALLHFSLSIAHVFSLIPYSHIETSGFPLWSLFPMFLGLVVFVVWMRKNH